EPRGQAQGRKCRDRLRPAVAHPLRATRVERSEQERMSRASSKAWAERAGKVERSEQERSSGASRKDRAERAGKDGRSEQERMGGASKIGWAERAQSMRASSNCRAEKAQPTSRARASTGGASESSSGASRRRRVLLPSPEPARTFHRQQQCPLPGGQGDSTDRHGLAPTVLRGAAGIVT